MQSPKPMQYILFINTISKFKIEGGIFCPSYNVFPTTSISPRLSHNISQNVFLTTFFVETTSSTSISQRISHDVFPTTSSFLTTTFQQCFSYNVFLTTILSQCLYNNVFLKTTFSQRLSHNVFLTTS